MHRWFAALDERAVDELIALDLVAYRPRAQGLERGHLRRLCRDDELPQTRARHVVALTELVEERSPLDAQPRLERARWIVQPRVNHAAVVGARFETGAWMSFQHADRASRLGDRKRRREAGDARANHSDVDPFHSGIVAEAQR